MRKWRVAGTLLVAWAAGTLAFDEHAVPRWAHVAAAIVIAGAGALGVPAAPRLTKSAFVSDHADPVAVAQEAVNGSTDG